LEKNGNIKDAQAPSVFIGQVGSADTVLKSGIDRDRLAREHDILAFESEGSGIWEEFPCVIVKGVCDYADSHNSKFYGFRPGTAHFGGVGTLMMDLLAFILI
jgi:nucleoside phosphorylase